VADSIFHHTLLFVVVVSVGCTPASQSNKQTGVASGSSATWRPLDHTASGDSDVDSGATDSGGAGATVPVELVVDADADGFSNALDCDDSDPSRYPGAPEMCHDSVVNDCEGEVWSARLYCADVYTNVHARASWAPGTSQYDQFLPRGVGDVDGDGYADVAIGSPAHSNTEFAVGGVRIYMGPMSGLASPGDEDVFIQGVEAWDAVGWDVVPMGDIDGDGYSDFAVGAPNDDLNGEYISGTPSVYVVHGPGRLSSFGEALLLVDSPYKLECLGSVLEPIPDADGDGVADILVGGRCDNVVRLLSGSTPAQVPGTDDVVTFVGPEAEGRFGFAIASGNLSGDGHTDIAIGDPEYRGDTNGYVSIFASPPRSTVNHGDASATILGHDHDSGSGHLFLGTGVAIGDLNDDGYDDLSVGAPGWTESITVGDAEGLLSVFFGPLDGTYRLSDADFRMAGEHEQSMIGGEMHSGHDLDGDGIEDLLVGNSYNEVNGTAATRYARGTAAYLVRAPIPTGSWGAMDADLVFVDSSAAIHFGQQTSVVGDSNGDGVVEILAGNWYDTVHLYDVPF